MGGALLVLAVGHVVTSLPAEWAVAESASNSYRIDESFIGPGGNLESNSAGYTLETGQSSVGNTGVGESSSANFSNQAGSTTTADPRLSCVINSSAINFGSLSTGVTVTGTASVSVLNYTSYGYNVTILGAPPSNGNHTLNAMTSTGPSVIGSEQFGINLKDNVTPNVGVEAAQVPDGTFSSGAAAANYNSVNNFRYVNGETIATAARSSGQTDYTISYIVNISTTSPGGKYSGSQAVLCTGRY